MTCKHEDSEFLTDKVDHVCDPSTGETETGGSLEYPGYPASLPTSVNFRFGEKNLFKWKGVE